jgi:hypothetical protein
MNFEELQESDAFKKFHKTVSKALMEFASNTQKSATDEMRASAILYSLLGTVLGFYFNLPGLRPSREDLKKHVENALETYEKTVSLHGGLHGGKVTPLRVLKGGK